MLDRQQESIIQYSEKILNHLLNFKKSNPDFTFSLRQRNSTQSTDVKRLESGMCFQGSHYIHVPLFKRGDKAQKIKTLGFVIEFDKQGEISASCIKISFKQGVDDEIEKEFHRNLALKLGITIDHNNIGNHFFSDPKDIFNNLDYYITEVRDFATTLLEEYNLIQKYIVTDAEFEKALSKINQIKSMNRNAVDLPIKGTLPKNNFNPPLNQILYGPPGTGKTYNTILEAAKIVTGYKNISYDEALKVFNDNLHNQIEFITFHQNYSYEDFIQGLRPDTENNGVLTFEKKDGVFKRIADKALKNIEASEKEQMMKKDFQIIFNDFIQPLFEEEVKEIKIAMKKTDFWITDVSDKNISFRKNSGGTGHTLSLLTLEKMYENENTGEIQGLSSYYQPLLDVLLKNGKSNTLIKVERKNFVIIIDEINRANISRVFGELITLIEEDKRSHGSIPLRVTLPSGDPFTVPSNLYIIGTMNTADKSIALLDIALRRRFEFVPMYPNTLIDGVNSPTILDTINAEIIKRKGHDFTIGHAYFMGNEYTLEKTINNKVIPLLLEYFINDEKEVASILKAADIEVIGWPMKMKTA